MKKKVLALIPTRLNSRRLPAKALLMINNLPLVMHVYKRVKLSKKIDDVAICCDDNKIAKVVKKYGQFHSQILLYKVVKRQFSRNDR